MNSTIWIHSNKGLLVPLLFKRFCSSTPVKRNQTLIVLKNLRTGADVFLVGTAHVSKKSAEEARYLVQNVKPKTVMVELDEERAAKLESNSESVSTALSLIQNQRGADPFEFFSQMFRKTMQNQYDRSYGIVAGEEFKIAIQEGKKIGSKIIYGDRPIKETLQRLFNFNFMDLIKLFGSGANPVPQEVNELLSGFSSGNFEEAVERMKDRERVRVLTAYLKSVLPHVHNVMLDERDRFMCAKLQQCEGTTVGVVGLAHLDGIERYWFSNALTTK